MQVHLTKAVSMNSKGGASALATLCRGAVGREVLIAFVTIFFLAFYGALHWVGGNWRTFNFYQAEFGPGVMLACGHGFTVTKPTGSLRDFLNLKNEKFDCQHIQQVVRATPSDFQANHKYLIASLGIVWRIFGVSWTGAELLVSVMFALTGLAAYALMRQVLPLGYSLAGVALFLSAKSHLLNLYSLRDYSKAAFVITALAILVYLLKNKRSLSHELAAAVGLGAVIGLGIGFRIDILAVVPLCIGLILLFYPRPFRYAWYRSGSVALIVVAVAFVCGLPILRSLGEGGYAAGVILHGLSQWFDFFLGLTRGTYEFSPFYNDPYLLTQIISYATATGTPFSSAAADILAFGEPASGLLIDYALMYPADLFLRALAALVNGLAYDYGYLIPVPGSVALVSVVMVCLAVGARSLRLGLALTASIFYLFFYIGLQFDPRHFFYLSIVPLTCMLLIVRQLWLTYRLGFSAISETRLAIRRISLGGVASVVIVMCLPFMIWPLLLVLQSWGQVGLFDRLGALPVVWLPDAGERQERSPDVVISDAQIEQAWRTAEHRTASENLLGYSGFFFVVDVDPAKCNSDYFDMYISYKSSNSYHDYSRMVSTWVAAPTRLFVAAVKNDGAELPWVEFRPREIDVDVKKWGCVERIGISVPDKTFPFLIDVALPLERSEWRPTPYMPKWLAKEPAPTHTFAYSPAVHPVGRRAFQQLLSGSSPLEFSGATVYNSSLRLHPGGTIEMDGRATSPFAYLVVLNEIAVESGSVLVAEGTLSEGGLVIGLLRNNQWAHQVAITRKGSFEALIRPDPGIYQVAVTNNTEKGLTKFSIDRIGWSDSMNHDKHEDRVKN